MKKGKILINVEDIIGKRSDKLQVVQYAGWLYSKTKGGSKLRHYYICECECGNSHLVQRGPLKNEKIHSCGCIRRGRRGYKNEEQQ